MDHQPQPRLRPVIRVFVSSTFSDMKHERNALEADAFPKLEELCQRQGFQFQAIDLRWGVSTEAGLDHRTMRICFDELRRAQEISPKPNFLILLGNRYGWRPLPEEISAEEFHILEHAAAQIPGSADMSAVAVLREWYREDTNAVPPVYLLQSRLPQLPDWKGCKEDAAWNQVQAVLWTIINLAMPPEQLQRRFDVAASDGSPPGIVRFQASATEQEIWHGALRVPDAREHVLAFFREIQNLAAFPDPTQIKDFVDLGPSGSIEVALQTEQGRLKAELRQRLGSANVFRNEAPVRLIEAQDNQGGRTADVTTDHLAELCTDVVSRLSEIIQGQIEEYWRNTAPASMDRAGRELEIEQREYERFAKERGGEESFVGRQVELQAILDYVGSDSRWPLAIHGASGCGKTALMARASQEVAKTRKRIERFIGVAPRSSNLRSLLSSLCQELRQRNPRADALPTEIKELRDEFVQHLQAVKQELPLILFLDALDQLSDADGGLSLNWIPLGQLPPHVKLVVSCLSDRDADDPAGQPWVELEKRQLPAENKISLDVFSEAEARLLLFDWWLPKAGRKVTDDQRARIEQRVASPACRQPIYLKVLFGEVPLWHSYDPPPGLGESVPALLGQLFDRLSQPTNHGPLLVNLLLGYLSASRHGLAESEILEILFADPEYRAKLSETTAQTRHELPPNAKRIPIALWSRLRFDLAPYLTERAAPGANVLTFYHRQMAESVRGQILNTLVKNQQHHDRLGEFFRRQANPSGRQWDLNFPRSLSELPFHLAHAGRDAELRKLFSSLSYLAARAATGQVHEQTGDYSLVGASLSADLGEWRDFLAKHAQRLAEHPKTLVALASHEGFPAAREQAATIIWPHPWLRTWREAMPPDTTALAKGLRTEVVGSLEFPRGSLATLAEERGLVFRTESLGVLRVLDPHEMRMTDPVLSIRRERPLQLACAPDASFVAVFYGSGEAELYRCRVGVDKRPASLELLKTFRFHLPECEDPVLAWHDGAFWFQGRNNALARLSPGDLRMLEEPLPGNSGELSGLIFAERARLVALRQGGDTLVWASDATLLQRQGADVITACICGAHRVAVVFTDGTLVVYDLTAGLTVRAEMRVGILRGALGWDGMRLLWLTNTGDFFAWRLGETSPLPVQDNQEVFSKHLHVIPGRWFSRSDGTVLLVTTHSAVAFRLLEGTTTAEERLDDLFGGPVWRIVRRREKEKEQWLTEGQPSREVLLGRGVQGRLYCAPDGKGQFFAASGYGPGLVHDLATLHAVPMQGCPFRVNMVAGDSDGGCWLVDGAGDIFFVDARGICRRVAAINLPNVSGAQIRACGDHLVWSGYSTQVYSDTGIEAARTMIFFRRDSYCFPPKLDRIGERFLPTREGICQSICYDKTTGKLVTVWTVEGEDRHCLRLGSVEDFAAWHIEERNLADIGPKTLRQAVLSPDGHWLGILNVAGEFSCVRVNDGRTVATLAASIPFTMVAPGASDAEFWVVTAQIHVYRSALTNPP